MQAEAAAAQRESRGRLPARVGDVTASATRRRRRVAAGRRLEPAAAIFAGESPSGEQWRRTSCAMCLDSRGQHGFGAPERIRGFSVFQWQTYRLSFSCLKRLPCLETGQAGDAGTSCRAEAGKEADPAGRSPWSWRPFSCTPQGPRKRSSSGWATILVPARRRSLLIFLR